MARVPNRRVRRNFAETIRTSAILPTSVGMILKTYADSGSLLFGERRTSLPLLPLPVRVRPAEAGGNHATIIEKRLHATVLRRRSTEHRKQLARGDCAR